MSIQDVVYILLAVAVALRVILSAKSKVLCPDDLLCGHFDLGRYQCVGVARLHRPKGFFHRLIPFVSVRVATHYTVQIRFTDSDRKGQPTEHIWALSRNIYSGGFDEIVYRVFNDDRDMIDELRLYRVDPDKWSDNEKAARGNMQCFDHAPSVVSKEADKVINDGNRILYVVNSVTVRLLNSPAHLHTYDLSFTSLVDSPKK